jgi:hypothetical protein
MGGLAQAMGTPSRFVAEMGSHLARGGMEAVKSGLLCKVDVSPKLPAEKLPQPFAPIFLSLSSRAMRLQGRRRRG